MAEEVSFEIHIPPELEGGAYSNMVVVWHSPYEFTIDFTAMQHPRPDGHGGTIVPCRGVSRVRLPVALLFELLKALNANMTEYEKKFGNIAPPGGAEGQ